MNFFLDHFLHAREQQIVDLGFKDHAGRTVGCRVSTWPVIVLPFPDENTVVSHSADIKGCGYYYAVTVQGLKDGKDDGPTWGIRYFKTEQGRVSYLHRAINAAIETGEQYVCENDLRERA